MSNYKVFTIRLDEQVAEFYEELAQKSDLKPAVFFRELLTNNFYTLGINHQVDRIEKLVDRIENRIDRFEEENTFNQKYYEDFSGIYMMMLWMLMKNNASKDEVRSLQVRGVNYAEQHYKKGIKRY